jgi:hypothetical protein
MQQTPVANAVKSYPREHVATVSRAFCRTRVANLKVGLSYSDLISRAFPKGDFLISIHASRRVAGVAKYIRGSEHNGSAPRKNRRCRTDRKERL